MAEEVKDQTAAQEIRQRKQMKDLLASPLWDNYAEVVQGLLNTWANEALQEMTTPESIMHTQFAKGVLSGLKLALMTPQAIVTPIAQQQNEVDDFEEK